MVSVALRDHVHAKNIGPNSKDNARISKNLVELLRPSSGKTKFDQGKRNRKTRREKIQMGFDDRCISVERRKKSDGHEDSYNDRNRHVEQPNLSVDKYPVKIDGWHMAAAVKLRPNPGRCDTND